MCLAFGGRCREWRPAVCALRVAISALAEAVTRKSTGEASGQARGRRGGGRAGAGAVGARETEGVEAAWVRRRPAGRGHGA
eukprot:1475412-Pleurochrysis_carterae.AAC.1